MSHSRAMIAAGQTLPSLTLVPGLGTLFIVIISGNVHMNQDMIASGQTLPSLTWVLGLRALLVVIISENVHMNQGQ